MAIKLPIYMDYHATTPVDPRVPEAMVPYFTEHFGNAASRNHSFGWVAEDAVEKARKQVAELIGANNKEIVVTSGATESNNLALKGVAEMYAERGNHIITAATEHKAILDTCKRLEKHGIRVTYLPVQTNGLVDLEMFKDAITGKTILVSVIKDNIDLMSLSGHKLYGPKGVGALYVRRKSPRVQITAQMDGGGHERGMRSGTLNVPGIVGMGEACGICQQEMPEESRRLAHLRDKLRNKLESELD